jgi:hypothetical protein
MYMNLLQYYHRMELIEDKKITIPVFGGASLCMVSFI